jgi:uncharacterized membrane protein
MGALLIGKIMTGMGFDAQAVMEAARSGKDPQEMQAIMNEALPAVLTGLILFTPLIMATWFAPALILFGNARPTQALLVSLRAVLKNWAAMLVNGLVLGLVLFLAALVPMLLGLLVAMPVLFGSLYASYQAIFAVWADEARARGRQRRAAEAGNGFRQLRAWRRPAPATWCRLLGTSPEPVRPDRVPRSR